MRLLLPVTILGLCLSLVGEAADSRRPNFLVIVTDDQSPHDLRVYNPRTALRTPVLDALAARGVTIDSACHMGSFSGAVCTPSRHMLMTGRTLWHLPIGPLAKTHGVPQQEQQSLAAVFNRAGYATMRTCKEGNSYEAANRQFAVRRDSTRRGGTEETGNAWHARQVLEYLDQRVADRDSRPFLIYYGFSHPHDTRDGRPELLDQYGAVNHTNRAVLPEIRDRTPPLPWAYLPEHPFPHGHPKLRDEVDVSGVWDKRDERTIRNETGRYFACCEDIDTQIGRVLDRLQSLGELDNTYVLFTSDHGIALGRHGLQGKQNLYEHTWRVPMIVAGPGLVRGQRAPGNVYLLDLLATLCDLAGIDVPASSEGISFRPVLEGKAAQVRDVLYGVYCGGTRPGIRCVKTGDWKLIKYDVLDGKVRETQLFHLAENPYEFLTQHQNDSVVELTGHRPAATQRNLAEDPQYSARRQELESLLAEEMRRLNDPFPLWDQRK